jgi:hypothetical protein
MPEGVLWRGPVAGYDGRWNPIGWGVSKSPRVRIAKIIIRGARVRSKGNYNQMVGTIAPPRCPHFCRNALGTHPSRLLCIYFCPLEAVDVLIEFRLDPARWI